MIEGFIVIRMQRVQLILLTSMTTKNILKHFDETFYIVEHHLTLKVRVKGSDWF